MAAAAELRASRDWVAFPVIAIAISAGVLAALSRSPFTPWIAIGVLTAAPALWFAFAAQREWPIILCAAAILLPPVPFPIGDSGAHPSILIASAGLLGGLARLREWRIQRSALNASLAALIAAFALSLGFAALYSGWSIAAASAARLLLFGMGIYVYFTASQGPGEVARPQAETAARWLFGIAAAAAIFGCIDFVYQLPAPAGFGAQFVWLSSGVYRRAQGLFYDATALGNLCAFFLTMSVVAFAGRKLLPRAVSGLGIVIFLAALLLSFSRAALGAAVIACLVLAVLERKAWATRRLALGVGALAAVTVVAFLLTLPEVASTYLARLDFGSGSVATPERFFSGRLETWRAIAAFVSEHPWQVVAGIGYKTLPYTRHLGRPLIADNMYLSTLVETGVFGLAALLALNAAVLKSSFNAAKQGSFFGRWMFCFWIGEMFQMMLGDVLTFWRVLPVYFWVLAQVVHENRSGRSVR
ncbi:MAG TPA: O-antigen ligase family protein [Bryobacteraceae bacterium]